MSRRPDAFGPPARPLPAAATRAPGATRPGQGVVPGRATRHSPVQARPRQAPRPARKPKRRLRHVFWLVLGLGAVAVGVTAGFFYSLAQVPLPEQIPAAQVSTVLDAKGREIGTLAVEQNRRTLAWEDIPEVVKRATLAAEDRTFYEHGAISYKGLARAAWANVTGGRITQGGSTISQQYIKNSTPVGRERTVLRKAREGMLAIKLEEKYSKDQILEFYLNTIYFGRGAYGVEAASLTYFGHSAKRGLSPEKAAFLAGAIRNPEFYGNPANKTAATQRRNDVLGVMAELGWLDPDQAATAQLKPLKLRPKQKRSLGAAGSRAPYFMEKVRLHLIDQLGTDVVNRGGLRVSTTLDLDLQAKAEKAVEGTLDRTGDPRAALVAIEAKTGAVRAMYGGRDFARRQFNYATDAQRQAGSTMKPLVLGQALADGISIYSNFDGDRCLVAGDRKLCNYGEKSYGTVSLLTATKLSINTVYLRLIDQVGPAAVATLARRCGIETTLTSSERLPELPEHPSLALGAGTVSTLQLTSSFTAFANRGVHVEPYVVAGVRDANGTVVLNHNPDPLQCMETNVADTVNAALQEVVKGGTGRRADIGRPVAGKTGTTNDNVDARFVGYTPDLVASVWLGYDDQRRRLENIHGEATVDGGELPAAIWADFMRAALEGTEVTEFAKPEPDGGKVLNPTTTSSTTTTTNPAELPPTTLGTTPTIDPSETTFPQPTLPPTTLDEEPATTTTRRRRDRFPPDGDF
jgi:penicillin-binding protein 1A